jgi:chromosome segregation ATPase
LTDVSDVPRTDSEREELEAVKNEIDRVKLHIEVLKEELEGIEETTGPLSDESWKLDREVDKIEREKEAKLFKPCPTCKDRQQTDDRYFQMNASERSFYDDWKFKN